MSKAVSCAIGVAVALWAGMCVVAADRRAGAAGTAAPAAAPAAAPSLRGEAADALRRAVDFYRHKVSSHGGYVYRYSADLTKREGEGKTDAETVWVQPPGTPAVGLAYLDAYERVREPYLLEAAREAGECLIRGQLRSGGWTAHIDFAEDLRAKQAYRVDPPRKKARNWTTFDDDKTQSALRFMSRLDRATGFKDARVHEASLFALDSVLKAQFPNGAWPQGYEKFPEPEKYPVKPAAYPQSWPQKHPGGDYWVYYTLNDNAMAHTIETLLLAAEVYQDKRYRDAAIRGGGFLLLAQMPDPQPAWAQQYDFDMHPVWARKFEPPAVSGGESQGVISALLRLYVETGERRFLEPVPKALAYLRRSALPDGQLARFYELKTNRPLYFTRQYELTHDDGDLPTHYSFKVNSRVDALEKEHQRLARLSPQELADLRKRQAETKPAVPGERQVREVMTALDERGAWVEDGRLRHHGKDDETRRVIDSRTFIRNVGVLSRYLEGSPR
jgi:PelA/Pel-15E family pectate lyase